MFENLAEMFLETKKNYGNKSAFATRTKDKKFEKISYHELFEQAENLSTALIDLGVSACDHVGIIADNRLEWILADIAVIFAGAADVPRGTDVTDGDICYILPHADVKFVFVENSQVAQKIIKNKDKLPKLTLILMDKDSIPTEGILHLYDLIERGKSLRKLGDERVKSRIQNIKKDDLFTLIYTSGTTGAPKGVMLTHHNVMSLINHNPVNFTTEDRFLSILPVWHIFERTFEMLGIARGSCTYYTNIRNLKEDLQIVRPTFLASAPRLWESLYQGIMANLDKAPKINQSLFFLAYSISNHFQSAIRFLKFQEIDLDGRSIFHSAMIGIYKIAVVLVLFLPNFVLDKLVLRKIREATGGRLRGTLSGGGALPKHIDEFFNFIGIPVFEGYGLTETAPSIAVRTFEKMIIGTVGPLYANTEIKLLDLNTGKQIYPAKNGFGRKGEIHIRGPQVMKGYYKDQVATEKVLKDGWFNTGDLGIMTYNNCLKIVGRSKETIVLLSGENVEPNPIENKLLQSELIDQCIVVGQDKKYLTVLIVPNLNKFKNYGTSLEILSHDKDVNKQIRDEIKKLISTENGFKSFEKIQDFRLLPKAFEMGDELTAKLSVKRHVVTEKYAKLFESMYM
ncbi:MAG: long-chain fatty acid--CoA ligase [Leptospiraceae bacterium]|nr:long-chain fatty acid--CoA ligase [Leptospiraceae bacterium]MCZ8347251.1 long-chain fatty acid--CoA ligase [Leptospiraceae bacterium]PJE04804.1 MAG: long-chain fatty acid--CoA ligase [Leptospira sp.]